MRKKKESLHNYMRRARLILKNVVAKDTINQSKAMCFTLQCVIRAFVKGLYDQELAEIVIEEEREIDLYSRAEASMIIIAIDENTNMIAGRKEHQAQASKNEAFDTRNKTLIQKMNLAGANSKSCDTYSHKNYSQGYKNWNLLTSAQKHHTLISRLYSLLKQ